MMKRAVFLSILVSSLAAFASACGPDETYCYDQHKTCKAAADEEQAKKDQAEQDRLNRLDGGMGATD